ncbi:MAG: hypothetical protein R2817_14375 [Flavobacteriales bacterium]
MRLEYPAKVLLAWGEAISGHQGLRDWLLHNGYPELGVFCHALQLQHDAREWLVAKGHPHLMAVIHGAEGNAQALAWLEQQGLNALKQLALCGDGNADAQRWLVDHGHRELAVIGHRIHKVKRQIDEDNSDYHRFSGLKG